ncbi:hypothetical protein E2F46_00200 [Luteimonas aestuarii]|uniref:Uncharacterized protein n=1 Tax=Luteimonas aestuarii TaxID=453837 RepID=A0A4R5U3T2_9GAMM|nr:hypothetical protein [Luteimonas aestuarii]TDK28357.1 hypothetical protein E2F46_00200 [Luteimonas aestuarii]
MSWLGLVMLVVGAYLAFKLVGALLKLLMFVLALVGAYWFLAPHLGWPTVSDLFYVLGPDFGGKRIEELADPAELARHAKQKVVDGVVDGVVGHFPSQSPVPLEDMPQPLPEAEATTPVRSDGGLPAN